MATAKQKQDELELLEEQLKALQSGKQKPGTYGPPLSDGSGMKVAQDKLKRRIEQLKVELKHT